MNINQFLQTSYTSFHATANVCQFLTQKGFQNLDGQTNFDLKTGGKYFCTKNGSAVIAFVVGKNPSHIELCVSHTDSPCLKIKGDATVISGNLSRLNVEKYGGGILYSFFDRPLKIAGRIFVKTDDGKVNCQLFDSNFNVSIPSLAIHHNAAVNDGFSPNVQTEMLPILGDEQITSLYQHICPNQQVLDADLFVVADTTPTLTGSQNQFLLSPRIDNLTSVFASILAISEAKPDGISLCFCADNEEIGSLTKQGAHSQFLQDTLSKICSSLTLSQTQFISACQKGMVLSVDNGHAAHPAFPQKTDITNKVYMNHGIVIKHHSNYATDGLSSATLKNLLQKQGIPYQDYFNRSDMRCGSTVGCIVAAQLQMSVCDIGLATLSMHSAAETAGIFDINHMQNCLKAFFEAKAEQWEVN